MKNRLLMSTALSGVTLWSLTAPGSAADLTPIPPPPLFTWTGFYAGFNVGYSWGDTGQSLSWNDPLSFLPNALPGGTPGSTVGTLFPTSFGGDPGGVAGGVQLGYNVEVENFLLGLETDVDAVTDSSGGHYTLAGSYDSVTTTASLFSSTVTSVVSFETTTVQTSTITSTLTTTMYLTSVSVSVSASFTTLTSTFATSTTTTSVTTGTSIHTITTSAPFSVSGAGRAKVDWVSTFRTRVGFVADRALIYVTGGLAIGGVSQSTWTTLSIGGSSPSTYTWNASHSNIRVGGTIGGGIEYALTDNLSIRGQYLYFDLGKSRYGITQTSGAATGIWGTSHSSELNGSLVSIGLNWRFGSQ